MRIGMVKLGGWGDGADGIVLATAIKKRFPNSRLIVFTDSKPAYQTYKLAKAVDWVFLTKDCYEGVVRTQAWKFDLFFDFRPHVGLVYEGDIYKRKVRLISGGGLGKLDERVSAKVTAQQIRRHKHYNSWETNKLQELGKRNVMLALESVGLEGDYTSTELWGLPPNPIEGKYITIGIGADGLNRGLKQTKCWPFDKWQEVVDWLVDRGYRVVQIGIRGEKKLKRCEYFWSKPIPQVISVLRDSILHLGNENGPVRVRKLVTGKPSIVLFGPTHPVMYGLEGNINIWTGICRPCFWLTGDWFWKCPMDWDCICMKSISVGMVINRIREILDENSDHD